MGKEEEVRSGCVCGEEDCERVPVLCGCGWGSLAMWRCLVPVDCPVCGAEWNPVLTDAEVDTLYDAYIDREPSDQPLVVLGRLDVSRAPNGGGDGFGGLLRVLSLVAIGLGLMLILWGMSL